MKLHIHTEVSSDLIKKIAKYFPAKKYKSQCPLFYEGQIPITGYLILAGSIKIKKKKKEKILETGSIIGIFELMNKTPSQISAEVLPNSNICFLDKTTLLEFFNNPENDISSLIIKLCQGSL
jgi:CRP-like cAMP-binding protein